MSTMDQRKPCDFCATPGATYVLPTRPFAVDMLGIDDFNKADAGVHHVGKVSFTAGWHCCGDCAGLIDANRWTSLARNVEAVWATRHGPMPQEIRSALRHLHRLVRAHISGSMRPAGDT